MPNGRYRVIWFAVGLWLLFSLIFLVLLGYYHPWTGFGAYPTLITTPSSGTAYAPVSAQREKTLWDWMDLLIIPLALALVAVWFNWRQKSNELLLEEQRYRNDQEIALNKTREDALQNYFDKMTNLMLDKDLIDNSSKLEREIKAFSHARTLAVLSALDGDRKGALLLFLYDAELIIGNQPRVSLEGADLNGAQLTKADLTGANLSNAILDDAKLEGAYLVGADLTDAKLNGAILIKAHLNKALLNKAHLRGAHLVGADLRTSDLFDADLTGADLSDAVMKGADLTGANLSDAVMIGADLTGAILRDATIDPKQLKSVGSIRGTVLPDGKRN